MAAQLEGGAYLSSFVDALLNKLSSLDVKSIPGRKPDQKLLQRLKKGLLAARSVLDDAEWKQIKDQEVKKWLVDLQDVVYMADDLFDEVSTKAATATQRDTGNSSWSQYVDSELEDSEMAIVNRMERIIDTLESIVELKYELDLKDISKEEDNSKEDMSWRITTSLVEISDMYGRDKDKKNIIESLLDDTFDAKIPVISIVGIGGIGKTTLAQWVYNDDKVKGKFNIRAWVCVAEKFDVINITKTITEAITSCPCNMNNFDLLQTHLKKELTGKTSLIVLDDVWNVRLDEWNNLLKPFQYGNKGSKILLTTRNEKVASSMMPSIAPCKLDILSDEDCWLVFLEHSFLSAKSREYATLEQIGRRIVKKCKGLPLAVKTLGGLLRTKYDVRDWNDILESEIWEFSEDESKIIPALRISYHYLPSHLKRCFVYCSLYPKDYPFDIDELILLWMAEDLLQPKRRETLEEIGCVYFDELVARSFFQPSDTDDNLFIMHDLVHDLATFFAGEFYIRAEEPVNAAKIGIKTRHLSCNPSGNYPISKLLEACDRIKFMRTFLSIDLFPRGLSNMKNNPCILLPQLKYLRVLSFKRFNLKSLPDSIGELIHLHYLDLSHTLIVTLPESLSKLYNLQTLKLRDCTMLEMLPNCMQDLVNLRHLDTTNASSLKEMPKGMSKLKHLQVLSHYIAGKHEENGLKELGALENLRGSLCIDRLENVINSGEALEAKMAGKKHIDILELNWSSYGDVVDSQIERDILDKLRPHGNLKELSIWGYRGTRFPDWFGLSSYHNMTKLSLGPCKDCCMLPSLGQLPSLKHLEIFQFGGLEGIGPEFYKSDGSFRETPFPSLETLRFSGMSCWRAWHSIESDAFPQLKKLSITGCRVLTGDLPDHLAALEELIITGCEQLACSLPRAPAVRYLRITGVNEMRMQEPPHSPHTLSIEGSQLVESVLQALTHTHPTCLQSLDIRKCSSAISFPGDYLPASLEELDIFDCKILAFSTQQQYESLKLITVSDCDSLTSFPLAAFPNLRGLKIRDCENMKCLEVSQDDALPSLRSLQISDCPRFVSFSALGLAAPQLEDLFILSCPEIDSLPEGGLPPNLRYLCLRESRKLARCLTSMDLQSQGLAHLTLDSCDDVESFPKEGCLPASLKSLELSNFPSLETFDWKGLLHLTSLEELTIVNCPKLKNMGSLIASFSALPRLVDLRIHYCPEIDSFPEGGLLPNLESLLITGCEKLVRCLASMDFHTHGLTRLEIYGACESVKSFPKEGCLPASLRNLQLWSFTSLETFDWKGLLHLTSLQSLAIGNCPKLKNMGSLIASFSALSRLVYLGICDCPEIDSFPEGGLPPNLETLRITECEKLVRCLASSMDFHTHGLTRLEIGGPCESVKSFPKEGCLPASLKSLELSNFPSLETLDCKGLLHLTSLKTLWITNCPKLENMTEGNLPACITDLCIVASPLEHKL